MVITELSLEARGYQEDEIWGDVPAGLADIPGVIKLDSVAGPSGLEDQGKAYLKSNPLILAEAIRRGRDIAGFARSHGKELLIGFGVAALVGAAVGGVVFYNGLSR